MNNDKFIELRNTYKYFVFEKYEFSENEEAINIKFYFEIPKLIFFRPEIKIFKNSIRFKKINDNMNIFIFHIGLIELISYWKCCCPKNIIIKCGYLNREQVDWFKKLYYYGLGEFFYTNGIETNIDDFVNISCDYADSNFTLPLISDIHNGTIIPVGGGKDSVVTLELLKGDNYALIVNPKQASLDCCYTAGYTDEKIIKISRIIDKKLIELNKKGFINGHTPFSSLLAFLSYFIAFISNKKYIALSNESSANESNVVGRKINHQYSKSYEFERDFNSYINSYLCSGINYFSFLRPINELQIAMIFSKFPKYHNIFKSCNIGSKNNPWVWCCDCPKCLFVYIVLSPFLYKDQLVNIFSKDLFEEESLLNTFIDLLGFGANKPFECVGTFDEVRFAVSKVIDSLKRKNIKLPLLLEFYNNNYTLELNDLLIKQYNNENCIPTQLQEILKNEVYDVK